MWAGSGSPGHPSLQTSTELTSRSTQPELEVGARRGGACGPMVSLGTPRVLGMGATGGRGWTVWAGGAEEGPTLAPGKR